MCGCGCICLTDIHRERQTDTQSERQRPTHIQRERKRQTNIYKKEREADKHIMHRHTRREADRRTKR